MPPDEACFTEEEWISSTQGLLSLKFGLFQIAQNKSNKNSIGCPSPQETYKKSKKESISFHLHACFQLL